MNQEGRKEFRSPHFSFLSDSEICVKRFNPDAVAAARAACDAHVSNRPALHKAIASQALDEALAKSQTSELSPLLQSLGPIGPQFQKSDLRKSASRKFQTGDRVRNRVGEIGKVRMPTGNQSTTVVDFITDAGSRLEIVPTAELFAVA
jgi:hypothetical protein